MHMETGTEFWAFSECASSTPCVSIANLLPFAAQMFLQHVVPTNVWLPSCSLRRRPLKLRRPHRDRHRNLAYDTTRRALAVLFGFLDSQYKHVYGMMSKSIAKLYMRGVVSHKQPGSLHTQLLTLQQLR
jgi:hypothetical protein